MPSNPVLVTASEVPESAVVALREWHNMRPRMEYALGIEAILSDPAIQTLIVRKVVEARAITSLGGVRVLIVPMVGDETHRTSVRVDDVFSALLPTRGPDHG